MSYEPSNKKEHLIHKSIIDIDLLVLDAQKDLVKHYRKEDLNLAALLTDIRDGLGKLYRSIPWSTDI